MPTRFGASDDGPRLTVAEYMKSPTRIRNLVLDMADQMFIGDALLRKGPSAVSGAVVYRESESLYSDEDEAQIISEFGEIPGAEISMGVLRSARTTKRGLAVKVSQEMRDRNDVGVLEDNMRKVRNTITRTWDGVFMNAIFNNPNVNTVTSDGWLDGGTATRIRRNIADASYEINSAYQGDNEDNNFGFEPDVLILHPAITSEFLDNDEVNKVFAGGDIADENLRYTGKMPRKFFGLNVLKSWQVPKDTAIVMQRNIAGFISDERPLNGTPLYEDRPRETWRSDFVRSSVVGLDNPQAVTLITGINQPPA